MFQLRTNFNASKTLQQGHSAGTMQVYKCARCARFAVYSVVLVTWGLSVIPAAQAQTAIQAPTLQIIENTLEESLVRFMDQNARLVVRKLRFADGLELRRLTALHLEGLDFVFFHFFEPSHAMMNFDPTTGQLSASERAPQVAPQPPPESFDPKRMLSIRSLPDLSVKGASDPATALDQGSIATLLSQANPCEKTEIPGLAKLSLKEDPVLHSIYSLPHAETAPLLRANVWVCARLL